MSSPPQSSPMASVSASSRTSAKKPQPLQWTQEEMVQLIWAYEEKWHALRRAQLKLSQWEEMAMSMAARCDYEYREPSKFTTH
ncbi:hypothetical protein ACFX15_029286 [Malus domestica]